MDFNNKLQPVVKKTRLFHRSPSDWESFDLDKVGTNEGDNRIEQAQKGIYTVQEEDLPAIYDEKDLKWGDMYGDNFYEFETDGKIFTLEDREGNRYRYGDKEGELSTDELIDLVFGADYPHKELQRSYIGEKVKNLPYFLELAATAPFSKLKGKTGMEILEMLGYDGYFRQWETIMNPKKLKLVNKRKLK